uniref:Uncharacterized protein n=1 Tax=Arundo donax TaxID=35708 RepID=A0A0A9B8D1_ARUDO
MGEEHENAAHGTLTRSLHNVTTKLINCGSDTVHSIAASSVAGDRRILGVVDPDLEEVDGAFTERERIPEAVAEGLGLELLVQRRPRLAHQRLGGDQVPVRLRLVEQHQRHPLPVARHHAVRRRPEHRVAQDLHLVADDHQQLVPAEHGHVDPPAVLEHLEAADVAVEEEHGDDGVVGVGLQPVHEVRPRARRVVGEPRVRGHSLADLVDEELLLEPQRRRHGPEHALGHLLAPQGVLVQKLPERRRVAGPELQLPLFLRLHREVQDWSRSPPAGTHQSRTCSSVSTRSMP